MRRRALAPLLAATVLVGACSGGDDDADPAATSAPAGSAGSSGSSPGGTGPSTTGGSASTAPGATTTTVGADPATSACGSIVGGREAVATLPTGLAVAALGVADEFTGAASATGILAELDGPGPYTVFVPVDAAFEQLGEAELPSADQLVAGHIVDGAAATAAELAAAGGSPGRIDPIVVTDTGAEVLVDRGGGPANVVCADIATANGMIHLVDAVLLPAPDDIAAVGGSQLYTVDLTTGAATPVGAFGAEIGVLGLTVDVSTGTLLAVTDAAELLTFPPDDPAAATAVPITGVEGATLVALDLADDGRPLAVSDGGVVYSIDPTSGVATALGGPLDPAPDDPGLAFDVDPASGTGRVVVATGTNLPVDIATGAAGPVGAPPTFDAEDAAAGQTPRIVAGAFSSEDDTLYVVDATTGALAMTQDPDSGVLLTVGPLGVPLTNGASLDIAPGGLAYLSVPG